MEPHRLAEGAPLCLAFANTGAARPGTPSSECLTDYYVFTGWMRENGALGDADAERLARRAEAEPEGARAVLDRAVALRHGVHRLFARLAAGRSIEAGDLDLLDREWRQARGRLRLVRRGSRFSARFPPGSSALDRPLWTLADDSARLLLSEDLDRVKLCDGPGCTHLFFDTSRNRSRRWCEMAICGNRMKARRHYRRHRSA